jgi:hypothetical protein
MEDPRLVHLTFVMDSSDVEKLAHLAGCPDGSPEYLIRVRCVGQQMHGYPVDVKSLEGEIHALFEERNRLEATILSLKRWLDELLEDYAKRLTLANISAHSHSRETRHYLD